MYKIDTDMESYNLSPSEARVEGIKGRVSIVDYSSLSEEERSRLIPIPGITLTQTTNK